MAVNRLNGIVRVACADPKRRKRLERSAEKWLKYYLAETYTRPFEKPHREIIAGAVKAHETDGRFVVAGERGIGKSAILWGLVLYFALTQKRRFPACVPWADKALKRAFRFWKNALCFNERLLADYPEFCQPFAHSKGIAQRVPNVWWIDTAALCGAQLTVGEGMIVLPDGLGVLGGSTINGNIRGLNHPQADGSVLRPDMVLLDDVQDRKVARSTTMIRETIDIIDGDVAGCGQSGRDMPMLMACNCICVDDVSHHYLTTESWQSLKVPCIMRWPADWDAEQSISRQLWSDLNEKLLSGDDPQGFYRKHRKEIVNGMQLSAPAVFKGAKNCPDAFFGVIRMYYKMGDEAFMAERQQSPLNRIEQAGEYTLTAEVIIARTTQRKAHARPDWATTIIASTDLNPSYAASTVVLALSEDQTAAVLWYGLHKLDIARDATAAELQRRLHAELTQHGKALAAMPTVPEFWAIDAGGAQFDPVIRFAEQSTQLCGIRAMGFTGRGAKNYRQYGKTAIKSQRREQCHGCIDRKQGHIIKWVAWNADYWKEIAQRAWLGDAAAPGAVTLFDGKHYDFAAQVCADKLLGKGEIGGQMLWNFVRVPGKNDFGDAMAQGYAATAYQGIGTSGGALVKVKKKANVIIRR